MKKQVEQYLLHIKKTKSLSTFKNYNVYLSRFLTWPKCKKDPTKMTQKDVQAYKNWLATLLDVHGDPLNPKTINYHLIALRSFFSYLAGKNLKVLTKHAFVLEKVKNKPLPRLTKKELNQLLMAPYNARAMNAYEHFIRLRDIALLELLICTGATVSELSSLEKRHIVFNDRIAIIEKSSQKRRRLPITRQAAHALKVYFKERGDKNVHAFVSHDKRSGDHKSGSTKKSGLAPRSIQRIIEKYATHVGLAKRVTPHTLRHVYADQLLKDGANLSKVQLSLGHKTQVPAKHYEKELMRKKTARSQRVHRHIKKNRNN